MLGKRVGLSSLQVKSRRSDTHPRDPRQNGVQLKLQMQMLKEKEQYTNHKSLPTLIIAASEKNHWSVSM